MSAEVIQLNEHRPQPRPRKPRPKRSPQQREQARQEWQRRRTEWRQAFSQRLKYVRAQRGITEKAAATAFGVTLQTYRKHEAGQHGGNATAICRFCEIYNVSFEWLICGKGLPPRFRLRVV